MHKLRTVEMDGIHKEKQHRTSSHHEDETVVLGENAEKTSFTPIGIIPTSSKKNCWHCGHEFKEKGSLIAHMMSCQGSQSKTNPFQADSSQNQTFRSGCASSTDALKPSEDRDQTVIESSDEIKTNKQNKQLTSQESCHSFSRPSNTTNSNSKNEDVLHKFLDRPDDFAVQQGRTETLNSNLEKHVQNNSSHDSYDHRPEDSEYSQKYEAVTENPGQTYHSSSDLQSESREIVKTNAFSRSSKPSSTLGTDESLEKELNSASPCQLKQGGNSVSSEDTSEISCHRKDSQQSQATIEDNKNTQEPLTKDLDQEDDDYTSSQGQKSGTSPQPWSDPVNVLLVYHCWICAEEFSAKIEIIRHLKDSHADRPELKGIEKKMHSPICMVCGENDGCKHGMDEENEDADEDEDAEEDDPAKDSVQVTEHACRFCDEKSFKSKTALRNHMAQFHPQERLHQCPFCPDAFHEHSHLVMHKRIHTGYKPFACNICDKRFAKNSDLHRHKMVHTGEKPFKCFQCNRGFTQRGSLEKHARCHARKSGGHACPHCGLTFQDKSELAAHFDSVHKDRIWKCKLCGRAYLEERHLVLHEKSHTSVKAFACSFCNQRFSFRSVLTKHEQRMHQNGDYLRCVECNKTFQRRENLKRHMNIHMGSIKKHICSSCGLAFTEKGSLKRHVRSQHDQIRPHVCKVCKRGFTRRLLLTQHVERVHGQGERKQDARKKNKRKEDWKSWNEPAKDVQQERNREGW